MMTNKQIWVSVKSIELNIRCRYAFNSSCKCYWTISNIIKFRISYSKYYITNCIIIINIRLKYLEMIINIISKISYKMITLTWYKSFKQNIIKINININLKHIRRTNYENINLLPSNFPCYNSRSMRINTSSIRCLL